MRGRLARVGIGHAPGDDLGRFQRHRHGLRFRGAIRLDLDRLEGEPRVMDGQDRVQFRPTPRRVKRPSASVVAGLGQAGKSLASLSPRRIDDHRTELDDSSAGARAAIASNRRDRDRDARDGPALHVEQSPVDHLLRPERDVGGGLIVVGVELDPAGAVAGRRATAPNSSWRDDDVRGASSRNRPEPSARASPIGIS